MSTPEKSSTRVWLAIAIVFIVFWVLCLAFFGPSLPGPMLEHPGSGEPASYDWTLRDLDDQPVSFATFKGRPVFLNFWATSCEPCVREMPSIARLAANARLKDRGIAFVCVSTDDSTEAVRQFVKGQSWPMTFLRAERFPAVFLTDGIPTTFIIGPDGRIASSAVGPSNWDSLEVITLLETLAREPSRSP